jgi:hypothetical protein
VVKFSLYGAIFEFAPAAAAAATAGSSDVTLKGFETPLYATCAILAFPAVESGMEAELYDGLLGTVVGVDDAVMREWLLLLLLLLLLVLRLWYGMYGLLPPEEVVDAAHPPAPPLPPTTVWYE